MQTCYSKLIVSFHAKVRFSHWAPWFRHSFICSGSDLLTLKLFTGRWRGSCDSCAFGCILQDTSPPPENSFPLRAPQCTSAHRPQGQGSCSHQTEDSACLPQPTGNVCYNLIHMILAFCFICTYFVQVEHKTDFSYSNGSDGLMSNNSNGSSFFPEFTVKHNNRGHDMHCSKRNCISTYFTALF